ncbi:MAG: DUF4434 domain-containing protein [Halomonas sp.]|nr:DUF4434 domain-containing protein [Halomonas sp.]
MPAPFANAVTPLALTAVLAVPVVTIAAADDSPLTEAAEAYRSETLFYQPQNRDATLNQHQWQALWQRARENGVDTLIVQWTQYGEETFGGAEGWLARALVDAERQGLGLILGLYQDPEYYDTLPDNARFSHYWYQQLAQAGDLQQQIQQQWPLSPEGWYLPAELDDWLFHDPGVRQELTRQLTSASQQLAGPLHLSMFGGGFVTPQVYSAWAEDIADSGWQVWWQDDEGARNLEPFMRQAYRDALSCRIGVVREAFARTSATQSAFQASPATPRQRSNDCHPDAVFSLRYMPWAEELHQGPPGALAQ